MGDISLYKINLDYFPPGLRKLIAIGIQDADMYKEEVALYDLNELLVAQRILEKKYPEGIQTWRKKKLKAEINRRMMCTNKSIPKTKFALEWEAACAPFRKLKRRRDKWKR